MVGFIDLGAGREDYISGIGPAFQRAQQSDLINQLVQQAQSGGQLDTDALMNSLLGANIDPAQKQLALQSLGQRQQLEQRSMADLIKASREQQQQQAQARQSELLAKQASGQQLSQEELAQLDPTSLRGILKGQQPAFETESEKIEAKRSADFQDRIEKSFNTAEKSNRDLSRMRQLDERGNLPTVPMVKTLDAIGLPIGILQNPDAEEFEKIVQSQISNAKDVFGGRVTNFEVENYLKTIPSLMNSEQGRSQIRRNLQLENDIISLKYNTMRDIIKANGGRRPPNLSLLVEEQSGPEMDRMIDEYKENIRDAINSQGPKYRLMAPDGFMIEVGPADLEAAIKAGATFSS